MSATTRRNPFRRVTDVEFVCCSGSAIASLPIPLPLSRPHHQNLKNLKNLQNFFPVRIIKLGLISVFFLFLLWTLLSLLIPSHVRISKATNLAAEPAQVWALVRDSSQWRRWHPWFGDSSTALAKAVRFHWEERSDSLARVTLQHPGMRDLHNGFRLYQYPGSDSLTLQWYIDFHLRWYPWEKFSSLFFESSYGNTMQAGLERLKNEVR